MKTNNKPLTIYLELTASEQVVKAAYSLQQDLCSICADNVRLSRRWSSSACVLLGISDLRIVEQVPDRQVSSSGSYVIKQEGRQLSGGGRVWIRGHDESGLIRGIFDFSRHCLGIDALGHWTGRQVGTRSVINLSGKEMSRVEPAFRFRGFFIDQEDLLCGLAQRDGLLELWEKIYETVLRLGGNMVVPATYLRLDDPRIKLAAQMGLYIAQHHIQPFGAEPHLRSCKGGSSGSGTEWSALEAHWRKAIECQLDKPMIWNLSYRGTGDRPFWFDDSEVTYTNAERGEIISEAVARQFELLQEMAGQKQPLCCFYLYRENQLLYQRGYIRIPPGVIKVWCDNGYGEMKSYFRGGKELDEDRWATPEKADAPFIEALPSHDHPGPHGIYYHVSFHDTGVNERIQYNSPERIKRVLTRAWKQGCSEFLLLNVGNIREFVLGIQMVMDLSGDVGQIGAPDEEYVNRYLEDWGTYHFGQSVAIPDCYRRLFAAPWRWGAGEVDDRVAGDSMMCWLIRDALKRIFKGDPDSDRYEVPVFLHRYTGRIAPYTECCAELARRAEEAIPRFQQAVLKAEKTLPSVEQSGHVFFKDNILLQACLGLGICRMFAATCRAVEPFLAGDWEATMPHFAEAIEAGEAALCAQNEMDHPPWVQWHSTDMFVQLELTVRLLRAVGELLWAKWFEGFRIDDYDVPHRWLMLEGDIPAAFPACATGLHKILRTS